MGPAAPGRSLVPVFSTDRPVQGESILWMHEGNRAIRVGDWKLVAAKGDPWSLFDLKEDRAEANDLVEAKPALAKGLAAARQRRWEQIQEDRRDGLKTNR